ncbi:MAG: hypothetical protein ACREQF_11340 [Candidatus Binataceae bacterium]
MERSTSSGSQFAAHSDGHAPAYFMRESLLMDSSARRREWDEFTGNGTGESQRDAIAFRGLPHPLLTVIAGAVTGIGGAVGSRQLFYLAGAGAIAIALRIITRRLLDASLADS